MNPVDDVLEHFGTKGMRWGIRKSTSGVTVAKTSKGAKEPTVVRDKKTGAVDMKKSKGGQGFDSSQDAKDAVRLAVIAAKSGPHALDNNQLKNLNNRLQLESTYSKLNVKTGKVKKGHTFAKDLLGMGATTNDAISFVNSPAGKLIAAGVFGKSKGKHVK